GRAAPRRHQHERGVPKGDGRPPAAKGRPDPKPGETLNVRCWVLVRPPSEGTAPSTGHQPIPADGSRAKFYLGGQLADGLWATVLPNGVEILDQTPPMAFATEPAPPPREPDEPTGPAEPGQPDHSRAIALGVAAVL